MKKTINQSLILALFMSVILLICATPQVALGAEGGAMDNQVGIQFENDYTPPSGSSDSEEPPAPTMPSTEEPPTVMKPAGRPTLPSMGEMVAGGATLLGLLLVGLGLILYVRKKRNTYK